MNTLIISAFPGCGKTYIYNNQDKFGYKVMDSDSSTFAKHENWEEEYVKHIESNLGKYDFIFIAQYPKVLELLYRDNVPFVVVAPDNRKELSEEERMLIKQQWFGRFILRDNSHIKDLNRWLELLKNNYDSWTSVESLSKNHPDEIILLKENEYLLNKMDYLYALKENMLIDPDKMISLEEYKEHLISYYKYEYDNSLEKKEERRNALSKRYSDEYLQKVISDTYDFIKEVLYSEQIKKGTYRLDLFEDSEKDIWLNIVGGGCSDRIFKDEKDREISRYILVHFFRGYNRRFSAEYIVEEKDYDCGDSPFVEVYEDYYLKLQSFPQDIDAIKNEMFGRARKRN